ncbi:hypothetical protein [Dapis sp. BLCC M172]|uniref:hypothetical protein n=1 Tax=Dapis sp. BLCC M172 TaxID=2975281 RepID=UPI003CECF642
MQLAKNLLFSIRKLGIYVTIITGLVINLTTEIALAGTSWQKREITRIEWEKGKTMNCNGEGVEFLITGSNMHRTFYSLAVACLNPTGQNQADWVILSGVDFVYKNGRQDAFIHRFPPKTQNSGGEPNLYSFAKFVIGYNCSFNSRQWQCEEYSSTIENNVLKTFGSQQLKSTIDEFSFLFSDLDSSKYQTTNAQ